MDGAAAAAAADDDAEESVRTVGPAARALTAEAAAAAAAIAAGEDDDTTPAEAPAAALAATWGSRRRPHIGFELKTACLCPLCCVVCRLGWNGSIELKGVGTQRRLHGRRTSRRLYCSAPRAPMLLGFSFESSEQRASSAAAQPALQASGREWP